MIDVPLWIYGHACTGEIARWFDGCYCHSQQLKGEHVTYKRRRAMQEATGNAKGKCCWTGKRLISLAHGHAKILIQRMKSCRCSKLDAVLLRKPRAMVSRALEIKEDITLRLLDVCSVWLVDVNGPLLVL